MGEPRVAEGDPRLGGRSIPGGIARLACRLALSQRRHAAWHTRGRDKRWGSSSCGWRRHPGAWRRPRAGPAAPPARRPPAKPAAPPANAPARSPPPRREGARPPAPAAPPANAPAREARRPAATPASARPRNPPLVDGIRSTSGPGAVAWGSWLICAARAKSLLGESRYRPSASIASASPCPTGSGCPDGGWRPPPGRRSAAGIRTPAAPKTTALAALHRMAVALPGLSPCQAGHPLPDLRRQ